MRKHAALLLAVTLAASSAARAQDVDQAEQSAVPSAPEAPGAIEVASKFMTLVFDRKMTPARVVGVQGDWADVETQPFPQTTCMLKMHREPMTNPDGWVVQTYTCTKHKTTAK